MGNAGHRLPGDVMANSGPTVAASPQGDALYVAFNRHQRGATHADIVVSASYDRGQTWSKPVTATPADDVTYFQPNLAVDEAGRVAISAFALANGRVDEVLLLSPPAELRFRPPLQVTTAPFDPHKPTTHRREARSLVDRRLPGHHRQRGGLPSRVERHPHGEAGALRGHSAPMTPGRRLLKPIRWPQYHNDA